jgi:uncharacterized protein YyaL (SSP411 family)
MNRLGHERSPYLLQHKDNPVDWYAWAEEAFARARAEDKPIFLSIGYSTCHWCHVMAHESFEHADIAAVLNEHFVSIKVDREERPDVDRVYMTFVQATTGSGGWPMSVWLTPDLKPFYGGTYFPPSSRWGRPGFVDILREIARVWNADRPKVIESSEALTTQLKSLEHVAPPSDGVPGAAALAHTVYQFRQAFDARRGGFGDAPKFPRPSELLFLMREHARTGETDAREMALRTLRAMAVGGMRDHIGGGFHRYSVDGEWRVPHFEKMLYDQAQLVLAYAEAGQITGDRFYTEVAEDTLQYLQREMTDPGGAFYSAEDADSEGREGAFYVWTAEEIDTLLGPDAAIVKRRFGVAPDGNAPHDPQGEFVGHNILYVAASVDDLARELGRPAAEIVDAVNRSRVTMFQARLARPRPHLDDKILAAWNGLAIGAFARMARITGAAPFLESARRAAAFVREHLWRADGGTLLRRYRDGHAEIDGYAEDYAFLIFGLLELFQADADPVWLEWAIALQRRQDELFWDDRDGGWFSTTGRDASVLLRMKEDYDGAEPTASSVSVLNLLVLSHLVEDPAWTQQIERTLRFFGSRLEQIGRGVPMMAAALSAHIATLQQIVIAEGEDHGLALADAVASEYLPFALVIRLSAARRRALAASLPFVAGMTPVDGKSAAYVCHHFTCREPVTSVDALHEQLRATA